jgi:hypothetical protein
MLILNQRIKHILSVHSIQFLRSLIPHILKIPTTILTILDTTGLSLINLIFNNIYFCNR